MQAANDRQNKLLLQYELAFLRWQSAQSTVFSVFAMGLALQGALAVALLTIDLTRASYWLLALGFLMLGSSIPLVIRFLELAAMLDRQLLDNIEGELQLPHRLSLRHGTRLEDRLTQALQDDQLTDHQQQRLTRRRISAGPHDARWRQTTDRILTAMGQPTIVITSVVAFTGAVGTTVGSAKATSNLCIGLACGSVALAFSLLPWLLSTAHRQRRNRRQTLPSRLQYLGRKLETIARRVASTPLVAIALVLGASSLLLVGAATLAAFFPSVNAPREGLVLAGLTLTSAWGLYALADSWTRDSPGLGGRLATLGLLITVAERLDVPLLDARTWNDGLWLAGLTLTIAGLEQQRRQTRTPRRPHDRPT